MFLHPVDVVHVQVTERQSASCPTEPLASCAWSLCSECTSACHVRAPSYEDLLVKTRWPLCGAPHAPSVPPTWRQKRANRNPAATRSALSPANKWCLFASSLFVKILASCLSSRVRFRVMNPRSRSRQACSALLSSFPRTVSGPRQSGSICARNCC